MIRVKQKKGESRKDYLIRVAIVMLEANAFKIGNVSYDNSFCDALCLAEDLKKEFDIPDFTHD